MEIYDRGNKPCIIRNAMRDWKCMQNWTHEGLSSRFGTKRFLTDEVNSKGHKVCPTAARVGACVMLMFSDENDARCVLSLLFQQRGNSDGTERVFIGVLIGV